MADEFPQAFRRYCEILMQYCRNAVWSSYVNVKVKYQSHETDEEADGTTTAAIVVNPVYGFATVRIAKEFVSNWEGKDYAQCGEDMMHEMCHILTEPVVRIAKRGISPAEEWALRDTNEVLVVKLARIICDNLPKDWSTPDYLEAWAIRSDTKILTPKEEPPAVS